MNGQERINAILNRQPVDRIPVDLWLTPEALDSLRKHTGEADPLRVYAALGVDKIVWVFPEYRGARPEGKGDPWGVVRKTIRSGLATYDEVVRAPLSEMEDPGEITAWDGWPDPHSFDFGNAVSRARKVREHGFATIGPWISVFEIYCAMRGMENALVDLLSDPEMLVAGIGKIHTIQTVMLERFLTEMGDLLDLVFISDDLGTQESQLMSTSLWCEYFKPLLASWCELIHSHGRKVLFHTDGASRPFIPHLVDCGIDVLNPIQHVCPGMDRSSLRAEFGHRVIFHGGVDNQHVLPRGTADDVRRETRACLETLGPAGGYIPASCHNIQAGTPVENILALIEAVHSWPC